MYQGYFFSGKTNEATGPPHLDPITTEPCGRVKNSPSARRPTMPILEMRKENGLASLPIIPDLVNAVLVRVRHLTRTCCRTCSYLVSLPIIHPLLPTIPTSPTIEKLEGDPTSSRSSTSAPAWTSKKNEWPPRVCPAARAIPTVGCLLPVPRSFVPSTLAY